MEALPIPSLLFLLPSSLLPSTSSSTLTARVQAMETFFFLFSVTFIFQRGEKNIVSIGFRLK